MGGAAGRGRISQSDRGLNGWRDWTNFVAPTWMDAMVTRLERRVIDFMLGELRGTSDDK